MNKKVLLSTFNFSKTDGVQDYIKYFKNLYGQNIHISNKLLPKYDVIILIDDFSNNEFLKIYKRFKKENPNVKFVLVFTEFINRKLKTFNNFDFEKDFYDFIIILMNKYNKLIQKKIVKISQNNKFITFLKILKKIILLEFDVKLLKFKKKHTIISQISIQFTDNQISYNYKFIILFISFFNSLFKLKKNKYLFLKKTFIFYQNKNLKQKLVNAYYFRIRFKNIINILNTFDLILCSHPGVEKNLSLFQKKKNSNKKIHTIKFYPNKKITSKNNKIIYFSGEYTEYRKKIFNELIFNNQLNKSLYSRYTKNLFLNTFSTIHEDNRKYLYSLNPVKEENWPFSSPTRYIRSVNRNEVPIVFNKFNDYTDSFTYYIDPSKFDLQYLLKNSQTVIKFYNEKINNCKKDYKFHLKSLKNIILNI